MARALSNPVYLASPEKGVDGRTVLAKPRAPLMTDGRIGDFWIDTAARKLYGPKNAGAWPDNGLIRGPQGWAPALVAEVDGVRRVFKISDWTGGEGAKPATGYLAADGTVVSDIANAADFRGAQGPEMLVSGLNDASAAITDDTLLPSAQPSDENEKRPAVEIFDLGGALERLSVSHAQASTVRKAVGVIKIRGVVFLRTPMEPDVPAGEKFRTLDRWTDAGDHDSANGGWWTVDPATLFTAAISSPVAKPYLRKVRENVSAFDAMSVALAEAVANYEVSDSDATEVTAHINSILDDVGGLVSGPVSFLQGDHRVNSKLIMKSGTVIRGGGKRALIKTAVESSLIISAGTFGSALFEIVNKEKIKIDGLRIDSSALSTASKAGGYRDLFFLDCSNYEVESCDVDTPGAMVASLRSFDFAIRRNKVLSKSASGLTAHDGVIDQWDGCYNFRVEDNDIDADGIGKYGVLVTGTNSDGSAGTPFEDVYILRNRIRNAKFYGVLVNGRSGVGRNVHIAQNIVKNITEFHGIGLTDCESSSIRGNSIDGVYANGIVFGSEPGMGTYGAKNCVITENIVRNANLGLAGSGNVNSYAIRGTSAENEGNVLENNKVVGSTHSYSLGIRGNNNRVVTKGMSPGTVGTVIDSGTRTSKGWVSTTPTYTGTLNVSSTSHQSARYTYDGEYVEMAGAVQVTPAATGLTQLEVSLPVASNFGTNYTALGSGCSAAGVAASVIANPTSDRLLISFLAPSTAAQIIIWQASYRVQ